MSQELRVRETAGPPAIAMNVIAPALVLFCLLAALAAAHDPLPGDAVIAQAIQSLDSGAADAFFGFLNILGAPGTTVLLPVLAALFFAWRSMYRASFMMLATFVPRVLAGGVKELIERPRPSPELIDVGSASAGFSFPSGHTVATGLLFAMLILIAGRTVRSRPLRLAIQAFSLLMLAAAGPARVYVGAHWPSDVLASYLLIGLFMAAIVAWPLPDLGRSAEAFARRCVAGALATAQQLSSQPRVLRASATAAAAVAIVVAFGAFGFPAWGGGGLPSQAASIARAEAIPPAEAIATARQARPGAVEKIELEHDNGVLVWEIEIDDRDVKVDARRGTLLGIED